MFLIFLGQLDMISQTYMRHKKLLILSTNLHCFEDISLQFLYATVLNRDVFILPSFWAWLSRDRLFSVMLGSIFVLSFIFHWTTFVRMGHILHCSILNRRTKTTEDGKIGVGVRLCEDDRSVAGINVHPMRQNKKIEKLLLCTIANHFAFTLIIRDCYSIGLYFLNLRDLESFHFHWQYCRN